METSGFSGRWANAANGSEHRSHLNYRPTGASEHAQDSGRKPRPSSLQPRPPSSSNSPSRKHRPHAAKGIGKSHRAGEDHGLSSSSDEESTESSTATAPSAGAAGTTFPASSMLNSSAIVSPKLQLSPTLGQAFALSAQSPSFTPACFISGPSSRESSSNPSPTSSSPSASASPNSSRPTSSLMTRMGLGKRTGSGSSGTTSNTSFIGDDVGGIGAAPVPLGTVGAAHGATAPHAAEAVKAKSSPPPVPGPNVNNNDLEKQFQDGDKDLLNEQHDGIHPPQPTAAARVFSPFRPSSATASASFSALTAGTRSDSTLSSDTKTEKDTMPPETRPTSPKPQPLSNEAIEAAIQAAITGSSYSSGSEMHSSMRKRSVRSSGSGGGGSGYASERSESGEKGSGSGREGRASGSDSGKSHGPGSYGSGGDARSVPPRDTRTLLFVGNLPYRVRWQDLKDLFRRAGTVLRADVSLGPDNRSRGYGTVLLATAEDAGRAIDMLNGYEWQTRVLEVRVDRVGGVGHVAPSGPAPALGGQFEQMGPGGMGMNPNMGYPGPGGMYQGQLPPGMMGGIGALPSGSMHQSHPNVDFGGQQSAYFMNQGPGMQQSQGQNMTGSATSGTPGGPPGRTLFVGNLPYHVQWQDLKDLFRRVPSNHPIMQHHLQGGPPPIDPQGYPYPAIPPSLMTFNVLRADVALGPDGRSKGFGTVVFSNIEEADRARRVFSGYDFNGRQLKVHYDRMTVPGPSAGSPAPTSLAHQMMGLGGGSNMPSPAGMQMGTVSPQLHEPQSQQYLGAWSNVQQSRLAGLDPAGMSSPMGREASPLRGSSLRPPQSSSEYDRLQDLGQRPLLQHSQSVLAKPSHSAVRNLQNLERPILSARTSRREIDSYSSDDMDRARDRIRGWKLDDDRRGAGRGFGFDYQSGDEETGGVSSSQEDAMGSWEKERQRDRAKEQQLFQLLHGSRSQQQQPRERGSTETRNPTTASAPVSYPHSPVGGFARSSSTSSTSSSSPSMGQQHPYYSDRGVSHPTRTLSVASSASIYENLENLMDEQGLGMGMIETMLARRMGTEAGSRSENEGRSRVTGSSAANSTLSLPLGYANSSASAATRLAVRNWIEEQDEELKAVATLPPEGSTSSASGSHRSLSNMTSHSSGSGSDPAHAPSTSRRARPVVAREPAGSDADISEADEEDAQDDEDEGPERVGPHSLQPPDDDLPSAESPVPPPRPRPARVGSRRGAKSGLSKAGDKSLGDRQHPGPIELPPPPPVIPLSSSAQGSKSSTTQSFGQILSEGLFQQYHPFATGGGHDYARYDYSGVPTVQAGSSGPADVVLAGPLSHREGELQSRQQQQVQEQYRLQQQQWLAMQHQAYSAHASPGAQPGLPPITPSMPPFNLVPASGGGVSHFQARQRQQQQQAATSRRFGTNAPGPLSLPASQLPVLYSGQGQQPLTPPAYLHPLGSPGSPYLLGPHHPLNPYGNQHQPYHPQAYGQHPLAQSFGDGMSPGHLPPPMLSPGHPMIPVMYPMVSPMGPPIGYGPAAMTPGAPLTATGDMPSLHNPYIHGAVGAPVQSGSSQETKGYFDQVYTTPNPYGYGYGDSSARGEESGPAGIEREILKDSSTFGKEDLPRQEEQAVDEGDNVDAEHRPMITHSQSVSTVLKGPSVVPALKHASTEPAPGGR